MITAQKRCRCFQKGEICSLQAALFISANKMKGIIHFYIEVALLVIQALKSLLF